MGDQPAGQNKAGEPVETSGDDVPAAGQPRAEESAPRVGEADRAINQRIFETSLDLILVVDRKGNFIRVSPSAASILGYQPGDMVGRSAVDFLYPADLESTRNEMRMARRSGFMRNFECRYVHKDGRIVPLAWTGVWSEMEDQHFFIGRDMTERVKQEQLRHAQKMEAIGQLTGGVAHDFNNLLTVVVGSLDMISRRGDETIRHLAAAGLRAAERGGRLTQHLLMFSRRQVLQPETVDPNRLLLEFEGVIRRALGPAIALEIKLDPALAPTSIDVGQFESTILNLAANARDAMPDGGRLTIETGNIALEAANVVAPDEQPGAYAVVTVTDTGTGIAPEIVHRIFDPFFTTKGIGQGSGLGLSQVYGFVKESGGHVRVASTPGVGTAMSIYLPRSAERIDAASAVAPVAEIPPLCPAASGEIVLIVEDDADVLAMAVDSLNELGYATLAAQNADEALTRLRRLDRVDILFSDVVMPGGMNGAELAVEARRLRPELRILLTSGYAAAALSSEHGVSSDLPVLSKPYRREDLAAMLRELAAA
jgi:PAS domain S-box-containing protein